MEAAFPRDGAAASAVPGLFASSWFGWALAVPSHQRLWQLSGQDPWVRYGVPRRLPGLVLHRDGAIVVERTHRWNARRHGLVGLGTAASLDRLLARVVAHDLPAALGITSVSVPRELAAVPGRHLDLDGGRCWAWMWTRRSPAVHPLEHRVLRLDDTTDSARITTLATAHSPTAEGDPGTGRSELWVGVEVAGELVAVGALQRPDGAAAHLAGIVVDDAHRGRGWGAAVTAALTRAAVTREGVCTLGVYADNAPALRLYRRLGYRVAHTWHSRGLRVG